MGDTLCAFANMPDGGLLLLGLDEDAGFAPVGLRDIASLERGISDQARDAVVPPPRCEFSEGTLAGERILICRVNGLPLRDRPARYRGKAYLRQADGDYVMSEQEVALIELQKQLQPYETDNEPVPSSSVDDLDSLLVDDFLASAHRRSRRLAQAPKEQALRFTRVITGDGSLSLAGLYTLGRYPQQFNPSLSITCAVRLPRGAGARTRDLVHLDGPIPAMLDDAVAWVVRNTRTTMGYDERGHGRDRTELPMRAVREVVANALVHRSLAPLMNSKRVEMRLLPDKLVVTSPGGLWGVGEAQLGRLGGKSAVNPRLYDLCRDARMPRRVTRDRARRRRACRDACRAERGRPSAAHVHRSRGQLHGDHSARKPRRAPRATTSGTAQGTGHRGRSAHRRGESARARRLGGARNPPHQAGTREHPPAYTPADPVRA